MWTFNTLRNCSNSIWTASSIFEDEQDLFFVLPNNHKRVVADHKKTRNLTTQSETWVWFLSASLKERQKKKKSEKGKDWLVWNAIMNSKSCTLISYLSFVKFLHFVLNTQYCCDDFADTRRLLDFLNLFLDLRYRSSADINFMKDWK